MAGANNNTQDFFSINHGGTGFEAGKRYYFGWYVTTSQTTFHTAEQLLNNGHFLLTDGAGGEISFYKWGNSDTGAPAGKPVVLPRSPAQFFTQDGWQNGHGVDYADRWQDLNTIPAGADGQWLWRMTGRWEYDGESGRCQLSGDRWIRSRLTHAASIPH